LGGFSDQLWTNRREQGLFLGVLHPFGRADLTAQQIAAMQPAGALGKLSGKASGKFINVFLGGLFLGRCVPGFQSDHHQRAAGCAADFALAAKSPAKRGAEFQGHLSRQIITLGAGNEHGLGTTVSGGKELGCFFVGMHGGYTPFGDFPMIVTAKQDFLC
jgi:hypothetical protein